MNYSSEEVYTCRRCGTEHLKWAFDWKVKRPFLIDEKAKRHICCPDEIKPTTCRYCKKEVFWTEQVQVKTGPFGSIRRTFFELVESYGLPHTCDEYKIYNDAWREAKRADYAWEKARLAKITDGVKCGKCDGFGYKSHKRKFKTTYRACRRCRGIGTYYAIKKRRFLEALRRKYWPFPYWR